MKILEEKKKSHPRYLENIWRDVFSAFNIFILLGVFGFYNEGNLYFECIREIYQSCGGKPIKSNFFFAIFCNFFFLVMIIHVSKGYLKLLSPFP